jgi:predicted HAD superfamily Cof-like phosphohydrolase
MRTTIEKVRKFHKAFNQRDNKKPQAFELTKDDAVQMQVMAEQLEEIAQNSLAFAKELKELGANDERPFMRVHLIAEELAELTAAIADQDLTACLDALTDLQYVLDGTYLALGLHKVKERAFDEVHRSNMSKLGEDGKPVLNEGGRVLKGPNYFKPNLGLILQTYKMEPEDAA